MTPADHPNKKSVYISAATEARLQALGGTNRAENIRRALDLAECAEGLAEALQFYEANASGCRKLTIDGDQSRHLLDSDGGEIAQKALAKYQEAKQ